MKKRESGLFNRLRGHVDESYEHVKQLRAEYEGRKPESVEGRVLGNGTETILQAYEYAKDEQEKAYKAYAEAKDYESFRKQHSGRLPIISSGVDVDVAYAELNSRFGESLFPSDIVNPADQLRQIAEITDLKPRTATETEIGEIQRQA